MLHLYQRVFPVFGMVLLQVFFFCAGGSDGVLMYHAIFAKNFSFEKGFIQATYKFLTMGAATEKYLKPLVCFVIVSK